MHAALKNRPGVWFGWSGKVDDDARRRAAPRCERNKITYVVIDLQTADFQEYYNGFANRVLWPILHYRVDLAEFSRSDLTGYLRVNGLFADHLSKLLQPDDVIWVHDYHLMPLARELRSRGHNNPIGFFLHIPCPPPDLLLTIPRQEQSIGALSHYDLVGFQTENDRDNYGRYLAMSGRHRQPRRHRLCARRAGHAHRRLPGRHRDARTTPARRDAAERSNFARELRESLAGRKLVIGVDRLDYSKGIIHRIEAFGHFLETEPAWRNRVTFLQITPKSREEIPEYGDMVEAVNELVGEVNGQFGEAAWTPIRYVNRSYSRPALAGLFRLPAAALVTPVARRHEPRRQGIRRGAGSRRPGRAGPVAIRRRGRRTRRGPDRQSARDRGHGAGHAGRARHAARGAQGPALRRCTSGSRRTTSTAGPRPSWRSCRRRGARS